MTDSSHELDPALEEWLSDARALETSASPADVDALLADVEGSLAKADKSPRFWLRSRSTGARRAIACLACLAVVGVGALTGLRSDLSEISVAWLAVAVVSLGSLLGASAFLALRPLHRPPLAPWARHGLVGLSLLATFALALVGPDGHALPAVDGMIREMASPCLFFGLFFGLPVYLVLRLFDRGPSVGALIAACAAGLAGNLVLQLHCPRNEPEHLMGAHFTVVLLFVVGLYAIHAAVRRLRG